MKVLNLSEGSQVYTSNVYLITGNMNSMEDVNTLIDVGRDPAILHAIEQAPTGVGKHRVDQVILTHSHYDHTTLLKEIIELYNPRVYAMSQSVEGVTKIIPDGFHIRCGDRLCEVIHTPGHTNDSLCVYCEEEAALFSGDTPIIIHSPGGSYEPGFVSAFQHIARKRIDTIYFGHGSPCRENCRNLIQYSLRNVLLSVASETGSFEAY